jgi:O-antigen/teichoic acid export membrane protein
VTTTRLRTAAAWATVGNIGWAGAQWVLVWALARFTGAEQLGAYAWILAVAVPVFAFTNLQLRELLATDVAGAHAVGTYRRLRWAGAVLGSLAVAVIAAALGRAAQPGLLAAVVAMRVLEGLAELHVAEAQRAEAWPFVARALVTRGGVVACVAVPTAWATGDATATVLAAAAAQLLVLLVVERRLHAALPGLPPAGGAEGTGEPPAAMWRLARMALPLGLAAVLNASYANLPRIALGRSAAAAALGGYAAAATLLVPVGLLAGVVASVVGPRIAHALAQDDVAQVRRLLGGIVGAALVAGALLVGVVAIGGEPMLRLAFGPRFAAAGPLLVPLAVATALSVVGGVLGVAVTAGRILRPQLWVHVGATVCLAAACVIFVPAGGALGAAWAQVVGAGIATVGFAALAASLLIRRP